jgi:hypothetical protein
MLVFLIYKWQRTRKVWLDGSFDDLVAREVEEKTEEFYKYVNNHIYVDILNQQVLIYNYYKLHTYIILLLFSYMFQFLRSSSGCDT